MIKEAISKLVDGQSLSEDEARRSMIEIMDGEATAAQLAAFLVALRIKGESIDEILGMALTMRAKAVKVSAPGDLLDTCGTGGDGSGTYNISSASAFVAAGAGLKVAKHGNRSATSRCGSADVLEALGARLTLTPEQAVQCLDEAGFAFLFAPAYHPAMRHAAGPRGEIGVRTVFNILGPLSNPADASNQLLGVAAAEAAPKMAAVLLRLGVRHALVVHGEDGLDEVTLGAATRVYEVRDGSIQEYSITPEELALPRARIDALSGGDKDHNAAIIVSLLEGQPGPRRDALVANAAAALYAGDRVTSLQEGTRLAAEVIDSGKARAALDAYVRVSQAIGE